MWLGVLCVQEVAHCCAAKAVQHLSMQSAWELSFPVAAGFAKIAQMVENLSMEILFG